jgi:hypothetical protein
MPVGPELTAMRHTAYRARRWVLRELARLSQKRTAQDGATRPTSVLSEPASETEAGAGGEANAPGARGGRPQAAGE